jgi:hypothetical protein
VSNFPKCALSAMPVRSAVGAAKLVPVIGITAPGDSERAIGRALGVARSKRDRLAVDRRADR